MGKLRATGRALLLAVGAVAAVASTPAGVAGLAIAQASPQWSSPLPVDAVGLESVSCASPTFCAAVDEEGNALTYDGSAWSAPVGVVEFAPLPSVSCASATFCVAVDMKGNALTYDGSTWSAPAPIDPSELLTSVSCTSSSFCAAVDDLGNALTYDGLAWSAPVNLATSLPSVSCAPTSFCASVDGAGNALTYDGLAWGAPAPIDLPERLTSTSCGSASFCVAVDWEGHAFAYDGSTWSAPVNLAGAPPLQSVSCASASFCVAVGGEGKAAAYTGAEWGAPVSIDSPGSSITSVSCASSTFCVAVDAEGRALTYAESTELGPLPPPPAPSSAQSGPGPIAGPPPPPPPAFGRRAVVKATLGRVRVKLPGRRSFVPLAAARSVPLGAIVDASRGTVELTAARAPGARATQSGLFHGGAFQLGQRLARSPFHGRGRVGLTALTLTGALRGCGRAGRASASARRHRGKKRRFLWGDAHGNFSTGGRYAAATIGGTRWLTEDSCAGTRVKVARGVVSVRDRVRHRTVTVRAPRSYLARPGAGG